MIDTPRAAYAAGYEAGKTLCQKNMHMSLVDIIDQAVIDKNGHNLSIPASVIRHYNDGYITGYGHQKSYMEDK